MTRHTPRHAAARHAPIRDRARLTWHTWRRNRIHAARARLYRHDMRLIRAAVRHRIAALHAARRIETNP